MKSDRRLALPFALAAVTATALFVSGCGSEIARSAESEVMAESFLMADPELMAESEVMAEPDNATERLAAGEEEAPATSGGNLGSRLCVTNQTGGNLDITFDKADTSSGGVITPGQSACGEGTSFMGNDVVGNIKFFEGTNQMSFWATNPWAGSPRARLTTNGPGWSTDCSLGDSDATSGENKADRCFVNSQGAIAAHQMELWRHGDTNWKEFEVIIRYGE